MSKKKPILCLDFDGVLHSYTSGWQGACTIPDAPVPGAMAFLLAVMASFDVAIFSSRSRYWFARWAMKRWLRQHLVAYFESAVQTGATFDHMLALGYSIGMDPWSSELEAFADYLVRRLRFPTEKPPAFLTIDDRAITFKGTWPEMWQLESFKPWNCGPKQAEVTDDIGLVARMRQDASPLSDAKGGGA
jgi:hypothetical protein